MKEEDVPQDESYLTNSLIREMCYAVDKDGNYTTVVSEGWEPKDIALKNSIQEINDRTEAARIEFLNGNLSPIVYFMEKSKMDVSILASYVEMWKWRVKKHFKPAAFKKLNHKTLSKYAEAFEISVEELISFKGEE